MRMVASGLRRASKSRLKKALPRITILVANNKNPTADSSA